MRGAQLLLLALLGVGAVLPACAEQDEQGARGEVRVVTSIEVFADLIRNVAGGRARVTALVPGGADPHTYEPTPRQVAEVAKADVVFLNGLGLEETLEGIIENNVGEGVPVIGLAEGLPVIDGNGESGNPHLWLNVRHAMRYVERIRDGLVQVDPAGAADYRASAERYLAKLAELDREVEAAIVSIPAERRKLVLQHDAFPYFAERYGMEIVGFVVASPGREPSASEVADLADIIRSQNLPAVFKEAQFGSPILEMAANDAGVELCTLYTDAFGDSVDTYVKLIRHDADEIVRCLGG